MTLRWCRQCGGPTSDYSRHMPDQYILCPDCRERESAQPSGARKRNRSDDFDLDHLPEAPKESR